MFIAFHAVANNAEKIRCFCSFDNEKKCL